MALPRPKYFNRLYYLKAVAPKYLIQFLSPYAQFFASNGFILPASGEEQNTLDYQKLIKALMVPSINMPMDLINSLNCICEVATPECMDVLLEEAAAQGINLDIGLLDAPIDVVIQIWMHDRRIVERRHAEQFLVKPCTFVYFQTDKQHDNEPEKFSLNELVSLEKDLEEWFQKRKRGRDCRVFAYPRMDGIWFMVWHGAPYKRDGCIEHGKSSSVCYRPERFDVLIYQPASGELQIEADTIGEREVYRKLFGRYVFGDDNHFPGTAIYTLDPLINDSKKSLVCSDVPGIERIKLHKLEVCWGGRIKKIATLEADDVFEAIKSGDTKMPPGARIIQAWFKIKFTDSKIPRTISIRPSNMIHFQRDSDYDAVLDWLRKRGFTLIFQMLFIWLNIDCMTPGGLIC